MLRPIFECSEIRDVNITDDIRYIEFTHEGEYQSYLNSFTLLKTNIIYSGEHRNEINKWIIVINIKND